MTTDEVSAGKRQMGPMAAEQYHAELALSNSGMKDLAVSPLRYWYRNLNPNAPVMEPTPEMRFGTALHCLVLEGEERFHRCYARMLDKGDYPGCLVTIDDGRAWLLEKGYKPSGTRKLEVMQQVLAVDPSVQIWDVLKANDERANANKMLCLKQDWERVLNAADALRREPRIQEILANGEAEVAIFDEDPDTGIPLKAKLDWVAPDCILDLKTFTQRKGKSIDQSVADAIWFENYYRQAYFYSTLYRRVTGRTKALKFVFAFVESDPPHEVRIKELRPGTQGIANAYWQRGEIEVRHFCRMWADHMSDFGMRPWKREAVIDPLLDEEMRSLVFEKVYPYVVRD